MSPRQYLIGSPWHEALPHPQHFYVQCKDPILPAGNRRTQLLHWRHQAAYAPVPQQYAGGEATWRQQEGHVLLRHAQNKHILKPEVWLEVAWELELLFLRDRNVIPFEVGVWDLSPKAPEAEGTSSDVAGNTTTTQERQPSTTYRSRRQISDDDARAEMIAARRAELDEGRPRSTAHELADKLRLPRQQVRSLNQHLPKELLSRRGRRKAEG
jgi:hypothetical protein